MTPPGRIDPRDPTIDQELLASLAEEVSERLGPLTARLFSSAMKRTLGEALILDEDSTAFMLTGDIPAMWLRDSSAQMRPYLALLHRDPHLGDPISALVRRQMRQILIDPYANAFNRAPNGSGHQNDETRMSPWVWERKYEVDSLAFPLQLAHQLWQATGRTDHLDRNLHDAGQLIINTLRTEQDHESRSDYTFQRHDGPPSDTLTRDGRGSPVAPTGMSWSAFRPSDDACTYHYNVPGNLFAASSLRHLAELGLGPLDDAGLASEAAALSAELETSVWEHAIAEHPAHGQILAYEVDGMGHALLMDDANMPSLLSLPLTGGLSIDDPLYLSTRAFVLSMANPTYARGKAGDGVGSPHTPERHVWPIAAAVRGLTSPDVDEKLAVLNSLCKTNGPRGRMCESYHVDAPDRFTREWFSWADSMFCELVLDVLGHQVPGAGGPTSTETGKEI